MDALTSARNAARIGGSSVVDILGAVAGLYYFYGWKGALLAIPIGVAVHYALGIVTPLNNKIKSIL